MTSPAVLLPPRWLGRGSTRSVSLADLNQAVTGRRLFSQSAKTSSAVPCTARSESCADLAQRRTPIDLGVADQVDKPPTNAPHRMGCGGSRS
jgi:hypothetical protein